MPRAKSTTASKTTTQKTTQPAVTEVEQTNATADVSTKAPSPRKKVRPTLADVNLTDLVEVRSCVYGGLVYIANNGYRVDWDEFGASQYMTVQDLMTMRNTQKSFFVNNWVCLCGDNAADVTSFLQLDRYTNKSIDPDTIDDVFEMSPPELRAALESYSPAMRDVVVRRAYALIQDGTLDSNKLIDVIEDVTGYDLRG